MTNFIKLIAFIIVVVFCVFISKSLTPPTPQELVSSIAYIKDSLQAIDNERNQLSERVKLGLENSSKQELLVYKYNKINSFLDGGYKLSTPCDDYCGYLKSKENNVQYTEYVFGGTEETKACYEEYYLYANNLFNQAQTANIAYLNKESITKQEYKNIINNIKIKNENIIEETKKVMELTTIPNEIVCSDEICKNIKPQENNREPIYTKIGISKKCYDDCKNFIEAEGYLPADSMPCSRTENKKIIEYSKTHTDMFE